MPLAALAEKWSYVLQSRRRWAGAQETRTKQGEAAGIDLKALGIKDAELEKIAAAEHVEVAIGRQEDDPYSDARRVPWEYLISAATAKLRGTKPLLITRCLEGPRFSNPRIPRSLLFIESAPGLLQYEYEFDSERKIVSGGLDLRESSTVVSKNETTDEIKKRLRASPDIIHLAGFDKRQAMLLDRTIDAQDTTDGIVLTDKSGKSRVTTAKEFASWIASGARAPILVSFNCHYSGADLAALCVNSGAGAAIGFVDAVDDEIAEFFFGAFYRAWRDHRWDLFQAFKAVWISLRASMPQFHGTGIVLWAAESAFPQWSSRAVGARRPPFGPLSTGVTGRRGTRARVGDAHATFDVKIAPLTEINYSLLHNDQPIFSEFSVRRLMDGPDMPIEVVVELNVGSDSYPFRMTTMFASDLSIYHPNVKIPLISSLVRSLRERVQSTLYWQVRVGKDIIRQDTQKVTLLPVDEWSDDAGQPNDRSTVDRRSIWLPSFVLPRDPAVAKIIESAQRYLMALQDDPGAGFDGYQQVVPGKAATREIVDLQVRAIWCALAFEWQLSYINPPPSYSRATQRLRTPSDVINGKRGTCIDLALLLAACLEYVDIYPTLILLTGHAFPAYWRSDEPHGQFVLADPSLLARGAQSIKPRNLSNGSKRRSWVFRKDERAFNELLRYIQRGDLVPLETVYLTNHSSFEEARAAGLENLDNPREFDSMLDILQARRDTLPVTPLPIIQI